VQIKNNIKERFGDSMTVIFMDRKTGARVEKRFESPYIGRKFLNKVKRSKKLQLLSWWNE